MSAVIGFYKWMQRYGYIKNDDQNVVTHYTTGTVHQELNQHDMLAHTKSGSKRTYETSNIMRMFPKKENTPSHKKLKPMHPEHRALFNEYVNSLPRAAELIFRLCVEAGLRIAEAIHFPAHDIGKADYRDLDVVPIKITRTKGSKPRTVEIPIELYEELEIYKESSARLTNLNKCNELIQSGEILDTVEYLFISNKGIPYSVNTLETHFSNLRKQIRKMNSSWYYRIHDLRSTFATHWLWLESQKRAVGADGTGLQRDGPDVQELEPGDGLKEGHPAVVDVAQVVDGHVLANLGYGIELGVWHDILLNLSLYRTASPSVRFHAHIRRSPPARP
jgi:integrase